MYSAHMDITVSVRKNYLHQGYFERGGQVRKMTTQPLGCSGWDRECMQEENVPLHDTVRLIRQFTVLYLSTLERQKKGGGRG